MAFETTARPSADPGPRSERKLIALLLLGLVGTASTGCQTYNWRDDFERAEAEARDKNKDLFIFYKWYLDNDSNRMLSSEVLSDPKVVGLFQDSINLLIEKEYGPRYVAYVGRYGVTTYPSSIIVRPDGTFAVKKGFTPKKAFIAFVERARGDADTQPKSARRAPAQRSRPPSTR